MSEPECCGRADDARQEEDDILDPFCPLCHECMEVEVCWHCLGAGGFHDCGEDCCCCLDPDDDLNEGCPECGGHGEYLVCPDAGRPGHGEVVQ